MSSAMEATSRTARPNGNRAKPSADPDISSVHSGAGERIPDLVVCRWARATMLDADLVEIEGIAMPEKSFGVSRRAFLTTTAAAVSAAALPLDATLAQAPAKYRRLSLSNPQSARALASYKKA